MREEWKMIPSFPAYEASSLGRIRRNGKVLRPYQGKDRGYLNQVLCVNGKTHTRGVHVLVCEAFHGKCPVNKRVTAHNDGNKSNNVPSNLRWATHKENSADMIEHGTKLELDWHPRSTITSEQVLEILKIYELNMVNKHVKRGTREFIMNKYNITLNVLKDILRGKSWSKITGRGD